MAGKPSQPSFLWQAILILLPVAVLAVIGCISLRQDKLLAEHDARERAQAIADQMLPTLWTQFMVSPGNESNDVAFRVDEWGQLVFPPPCDSAPSPKPFSLAELSPEQAELWTASQATTAGTPADAIAACGRFIDSNPPERFAAAAQYQLGLLLLQRHDWLDAVKSLGVLAADYPDAVGESGLPLRPLAEFKMMELQPSAVGPADVQFKLKRGPEVWADRKYFVPLETFCSNIVYHPSLLTPYLLNQAGESNAAQANQLATVREWQGVWEKHERAREVFAAVSDHFSADASGPFLSIGTNKIKKASSPRAFWFALSKRRTALTAADEHGQVVTMDEDWIATRSEEGTNSSLYLCRPEPELGLSISKAAGTIPSYFGVRVELAGKGIAAGAPPFLEWRYDYVGGGKGGGQYLEKKYSDRAATNLLASASRTESGMEPLKVSVYLTNPDELFASQRTRQLWFGSLVIVSTVAALVGLFAAARAFYRQLRLTEMKSNFVSSVSHELRAPIASVRLMAESLERGKVVGGEKQNEYFRFIVQECRRLSSLIENVLDFSRIEQGRKQYEFEPTDLLALTRETVKLMEPYAEEKGVVLETSNIEHRTPSVELEVDGRAMQQALVNLIDNAIKHSAKGQTVTIGVDDGQRASGVSPDPGVTTAVINETEQNHSIEKLGTRGTHPSRMPVLLYVEDRGAGIPLAEHEKIFERFYRLGSELRRETQGVGIGLSIVRHIVEAHGGQVTVRSNVGEGSRFTIVLPAKTVVTTDKHR